MSTDLHRRCSGTKPTMPVRDGSARPLRILVVSHSHPKVIKGGAEIAAFALFEELSKREECQAWFLGCDRGASADRSGSVIRQPYSEREYIYAAGEFDWFKFANRDSTFPAAFASLLNELRPDIVHFHHYAVVGVEALTVVRTTLPNAKIVMTLHEYHAICNHFGQMVTKPERNLCSEASPQRCNRCFPEFEKSDFFLRRLYIQRFFDCVDHFLAPSRFLAERYVAWGIASESISVIENVVATHSASLPPRISSPGSSFRIGFFGQISFLKGISVLLDAADILEKEERNDISFEIFGDYRSQPLEFQEEFLARMRKIGRNVRVHGAYEQNRVDVLMQAVDVVLMPSIWWENSPVVIQEAFRNRRAVICSDIGGMAEKVRDGIDGYHFSVGSANELAELIKRLAGERPLLEKIARSMQVPPTPEAITQAHWALYALLHPAVAGSAP